MAIRLDLFSGSKLRITIQHYCNQLGWIIKDIDYIDDSTLLLLKSARNYITYIQCAKY